MKTGPRGQKLLTDAKLRSVMRKIGNHNDGDGLRLKVSKPGKCHWAVRYSLQGSEKETSIGSYPAMTLAEARERKDTIKLAAKRGISHRELRDSETLDLHSKDFGQTCSFEWCARAHIERKKQNWSNKKHADQWLSSLSNYAFPKLAELNVNDIGVRHIESVLRPIWNTIPETAQRVRQRIESVLDFTIAMEYRSDRFNPASWKGNLAHVLSQQSFRAVRHHHSLDYNRIPDLMVAAAKKDSISSIALQLCILTVNRTSPVIKAEWDQINLESRIWTIPPSLMKTRKEFRVPLNDFLTSLLKRIPKHDSRYVFPSPQNTEKHLHQDSLRIHLHRDYPSELINISESDQTPQRATVHGFRSSFRIWAAEQTTASNEVIEMAMQHAIKNSVEAAYQRSDLLDKRAMLLNEWAKFCQGQVDSRA